MQPLPFEVRTLQSEREVAQFFQLSAEAFGPAGHADRCAEEWRELVTADPAFVPQQLQGAVRDGRLLGGYTLFERSMLLRGVAFQVACIGAVVTAPAERRQGVARALMRDAIERATAQGCAFMLLHGMPNLYTRFGYAPAFERTRYRF